MKPELGKEVESDPELADFIWNGSDALLPMNQTIYRTNKARLDYIVVICMIRQRSVYTIHMQKYIAITRKNTTMNVMAGF